MSHDKLSENEETVNKSQQCVEQMYTARMVGSPQGNNLIRNVESEIRDLRSVFTNEQTALMTSYNSNITTPIDIAQLNDRQRFVFLTRNLYICWLQDKMGQVKVLF